MKYYISYKYHRIEERVENNEKKKIEWSSYSSDSFDIDFEIKNEQDIDKLHHFIFDKLKPDCEIRNQQLTALLILGIFKLEK